MTKKTICTVLTLVLLTGVLTMDGKLLNTFASESDALNLSSRSAVLMEPETGTIIYEKNAHERLRPASITKIMTLLLIYEAVDSGKLDWDQEITVSKHAESMGGSQVYLEAGEIQTVATLTKCIAVASANDAAVAMAEAVAGSEEAFVVMMNEKAEELGMENTHFMNASGLDTDDHYSSAYDIALMARELTTKYPQIFELSSIWMDTIVHNTARGSEEFGLTNTNKLIQWYKDATGLKTGSTSLAKYCLCGTATRNDLDLIAVVLAAPDYKVRFQEVMKMFDYGFAMCKKYEDKIANTELGQVPVKRGITSEVTAVAEKDFNYILLDKKYDISKITKEIQLAEYIEAPVLENQKVGEIVYKYEDEEIGHVDLISTGSVNKAGVGHYIKKAFTEFFGR